MMKEKIKTIIFLSSQELIKAKYENEHTLPKETSKDMKS